MSIANYNGGELPHGLAQTNLKLAIRAARPRGIGGSPQLRADLALRRGISRILRPGSQQKRSKSTRASAAGSKILVIMVEMEHAMPFSAWMHGVGSQNRIWGSMEKRVSAGKAGEQPWGKPGKVLHDDTGRDLWTKFGSAVAVTAWGRVHRTSGMLPETDQGRREGGRSTSNCRTRANTKAAPGADCVRLSIP